MLSLLKNHPFAVEAHFECSTVLTYAIPKEQLQSLIPKCLTLDTFEDSWTFLAIAMVHTKDLRPKGLPTIFGQDFFLSGYRVFVKYKNKRGKTMRGLYILKSETNKAKMKIAGNIFTHYNYTTTDITTKHIDNLYIISSKKSNFEVEYLRNDNAQLPDGSPFKNWKEARRYAGPLPFTFTFNDKTNEVLIIEGVRSNWKPKPISIRRQRFEFLDSFGFEGIRLANAFEIQDIPYYWKSGKIELWQP